MFRCCYCFYFFIVCLLGSLRSVNQSPSDTTGNSVKANVLEWRGEGGWAMREERETVRKADWGVVAGRRADGRFAVAGVVGLRGRPNSFTSIGTKDR